MCDIPKLTGQLCFPLYAASRKMIRAYRPHLDALGLTYTQYITMMVLWEKKSVTVKDLGAALFLDSGTLTPLLKSLEAKGYVRRARSKEDERVLNVTLTDAGEALGGQAALIPPKMAACVRLSPEDAAALQRILNTVLEDESHA